MKLYIIKLYHSLRKNGFYGARNPKSDHVFLKKDKYFVVQYRIRDAWNGVLNDIQSSILFIYNPDKVIKGSATKKGTRIPKHLLKKIC